MCWNRTTKVEPVEIEGVSIRGYIALVLNRLPNGGLSKAPVPKMIDVALGLHSFTHFKISDRKELFEGFNLTKELVFNNF